MNCFTRLQICPRKTFFLETSKATDGTKPDLNIGETRVWRLDSGPNLQPCSSAALSLLEGILSFRFFFIKMDFWRIPANWDQHCHLFFNEKAAQWCLSQKVTVYFHLLKMMSFIEDDTNSDDCIPQWDYGLLRYHFERISKMFLTLLMMSFFYRLRYSFDVPPTRVTVTTRIITFFVVNRESL